MTKLVLTAVALIALLTVPVVSELVKAKAKVRRRRMSLRL